MRKVVLHLMKQNIAVIFCGCSSEHEISLLSASYILRQLDEEKYNVTMLGITKEGRWLLYPGPVDALADGSWEKDPGCKPAFLSPDRSTHGIVVLEEGQAQVLPVDVIFPVLHGKNGEDGTIQGLFALSGIPYVGCDTLSSAVCMDKAVTHSLLNNFGIEQAHYLWFFAHRYQDPQGREKIRNKILQRLTFPIFVKPANAGSSVGVSKVSSLEELDAAVEKAIAEDGKIVVEEGIEGQEVECAVLGNDFPEVSIVGEIGASAEFYDYDDKYKNGTSQLYIPARLPEETAQEIRKTAVRAYRMLGCKGFARVDFFVRKSDGKVLLNELNTLPGFTAISMYPKLWETCGLEGPALIDRLIQCALEAHPHG